jgi:outer membrane protein TolC
MPETVVERRTARRRPSKAAVASIAAALLLAACALQPRPLTRAETDERIDGDLQAIFADQEPLDGPITLHRAMARAIRYNLDHRVRIIEEALAQRQFDLARYDMLPDAVAETGFVGRSNTRASSSENAFTGEQSLVTSTSLEDERYVADMTVVWNVLDFGVSYYAARQQSDRAMIAYERRRRAIHDIVQDVRTAYWRSVAAETLLDRIDPLLARVEDALAAWQRIERERLQPPLEALLPQRTLLETRRQLVTLRRELTLAKAQLAALINVSPGTDIAVAVPEGPDHRLPEIAATPTEMERVALANRPELREEDYQTRVARAEVRKANLRLLPGLEFDGGINFDSNRFLLNDFWADYGIRLSWDLLSVIGGAPQTRFAEAQADLVEARRRALTMAVLAQVYVSWLTYQEALDVYETAAELAEVEGRVLDRTEATRRAGRGGELELIQTELRALVATMRRQLAYAQLQNAAGQVFVSVGADPLPHEVADASIDSLAAALREIEDGWYRGEFNLVADPADADAALPGG